MLYDSEVSFLTRYWLVVDEVTYILLAVVGALLLVAAVVCCLHVGKYLCLCTLILRVGESASCSAEHLAVECGDCLLQSLFRRHCLTGEAALGACNHKVVVRHFRCNKRRIGALLQFLQACVHHARSCVHGIFINKVRHVASHLLWIGIVVKEEERHGVWLLLVFCHADERCLVVGNLYEVSFLWVFGLCYLSEYVLDFCLNIIHVDVADHDHCLQVWTIPLFVVVA